MLNNPEGRAQKPAFFYNSIINEKKIQNTFADYQALIKKIEKKVNKLA